MAGNSKEKKPRYGFGIKVEWREKGRLCSKRFNDGNRGREPAARLPNNLYCRKAKAVQIYLDVS